MTPLEYFAKVIEMVQESLRKPSVVVKDETEKTDELDVPALAVSEQ